MVIHYKYSKTKPVCVTERHCISPSGNLLQKVIDSPSQIMLPCQFCLQLKQPWHHSISGHKSIRALEVIQETGQIKAIFTCLSWGQSIYSRFPDTVGYLWGVHTLIGQHCSAYASLPEWWQAWSKGGTEWESREQMAEWERSVPNINNRGRGRTVHVWACVCVCPCLHACVCVTSESFPYLHSFSFGWGYFYFSPLHSFTF